MAETSSASGDRGAGFAWFVAWRYLRTSGRRGNVTLIIAAVFALVAAGAGAWAWHLGENLDISVLGADQKRRILQIVCVVSGSLGFFVGLFGGLLRAGFSIFSTISTFGVIVGTFAPVVALSVMSGFETDIKTKISSIRAHGKVTKPNDMPMKDWEPVLQAVQKVPGVVGATPYLEAEVMLHNDTNNHAAMLRGVDPKTVAGATSLGKATMVGKLEYLEKPEELAKLRPMLEPRPLDKLDDKDKDGKPSAPRPRRVLPALLVGQELAKSLRLYVGDDLQVSCAACGISPVGPVPNQKPYRVGGLVYTGWYEHDVIAAYMTLEAAQKFLHQPGEITGIELRAADPDHATDLAARVATAVGPSYEVKSWQETNRALFSALAVERVGMFIILTIIVLVASFSIVSILIMVVVEKGKEIAILKSMGATDAGIVRTFLLQGLAISIFGTLVGIGLGLGYCWLLDVYGIPIDAEVYYISKLPVHVDQAEIVAVALAALGISVLATVYPAVLAARLRPIEGLRFQ